MGGKVTGAWAAIAVSSASASIVGVVYKGVESFRSDSPAVFGLVEAAERAPSEKGFVVDTTKGTSLPDVPAEKGPRCQVDSGPGRCVIVLPLRELKLNFFGHTVTLPADWYSSDEGDDLYRVRVEGRFLEKFFDLKQADEGNVLASDQDTVQNSSEDNNNSYVEVEPQTFDLGDVSPEQVLDSDHKYDCGWRPQRK